jgi:hypothetical protein
MGLSSGLLHRLLLSLATILLLFALVVYITYLVNLLHFPFDYDQGEGFELLDTILFSQFQTPYRNTEVYPFYASNYPPLYHILAAPFVWFFGEAYWYGRLLSFLSTLVTASAIAYAVHRETQHRWIAVLSGLAFLSSNMIYHSGALFRQHISMVMFETLAIVILAYAFPSQHRRPIALGLLLLIAAGYTKQLAAITAIAVIIWLLLRNPRRGMLWTMGFAVSGGAIFGLLYLVTAGEWWRQAIVANVGGINPLQVFGLFLLWMRLHGFLLIPAVLLVLYELYVDRLSLYSVWFIIAALLGGIGSGAWGGGDSYFATSIAALCILSGIFVGRTLQHQWQIPQNHVFLRRMPIHIGRMLRRLPIFLIGMPALYIGYGLATFKMPTHGIVYEQLATLLNIQPNVRGEFYDSATYATPGYANIGYLTTQADIEAGYAIVELIKNTAAPVLSEDAGFLFAAGRDIITNPTQLLNLWRAGQWQGDALIGMIERREFGLIILRAQFFPTPVLEAIGQHYERTDPIVMNHFEYLILRPKD